MQTVRTRRFEMCLLVFLGGRTRPCEQRCHAATRMRLGLSGARSRTRWSCSTVAVVWVRSSEGFGTLCTALLEKFLRVERCVSSASCCGRRWCARVVLCCSCLRAPRGPVSGGPRPQSGTDARTGVPLLVALCHTPEATLGCLAAASRGYSCVAVRPVFASAAAVLS